MERVVGHEVGLILTCGPMPGIAMPTAFFWYNAFLFPGPQGWGEAVMVLRDGHDSAEWHERRRQIDRSEAERIDALLEQIGVPGRSLDVRTVPDTSDSQFNVSLRLRRMLDSNWSSFELDLHTMCSGYEGPDQEDVRRLLTAFFALVEMDDWHGRSPVGTWL